MKPSLAIKIKKAKESITNSVNTAIKDGIPCFLLESIIGELHAQVSKAALIEYEQEKKRIAEESSKQHATQEKKGADPE